MLKWWVVCLCGRPLLYFCSTRVGDSSSVLWDKMQWSKSWSPLSAACLWAFVVPARFVALAQVTPQESQLFRRSVIAEVSNKLHPSLVEKAKRALGWECALGQGERENCSECGGNAPESKVTPVSYSAVCLYWKTRRSARCQGQKKESSRHTPEE